MAFMVDFMANPFEGYEDEETRRKRIEEQRKRLGETEVGSTTEKTYMDGSKTITQTTEVPAQQDLMYRPQQESGQFMRPVLRPNEQARMMPVANQNLLATPQNAGQFQRPLATPQNMGRFTPVSPDDFQNILEIESGNRDYTAGGQPMTSPKGARFAAQVMPSTARNPGFGIRPAQSETPEEYNRVGREYFAAMRQRYGDDERAAAAYNAGPGRVDAALRQAQQTGQDYRTFLPQETQQYLQKFAAGRQQPAPQQQPQQQPQLGPSLIQRPPEVGAGAEGTAGEDVAQQRLQTFANNFTANQNNFDALYAMSKDDSAPAHIRQQAGERAYELISNERAKEKATRKAEDLKNSGDTNNISKILASNPKDAEGSWLKLLLLGFVSPEAARIEAQKLGVIPNTYENAIIYNADGTQKAVQLVKRADGRIIGGSDLQGKAITQEELEKAAGTVSAKNMKVESETYADPTGKVAGNFVKESGPGRAIFREIGTQRIATPEESRVLQKMGVTGGLDYQQKQLIQRANIDLAKQWQLARMAGPKAAGEFIGRFNAEYGTNYTVDALRGEPPTIGDNGRVQPPAAQAAQAPAAQQGAVAPPPIAQAAQAPAAQKAAQGPVKPQSPAQVRASEQISTEAAKREAVIPAEARGKQEAAEINNQKIADNTYGLIQPIAELIKKSTGSGFGSGVDKLAGFFGISPKGAQAISQLEVLGQQLLNNVPRFEGPQSDRDVAEYKKAAGNVADPTRPREERLAALKSIVEIMKRNDKQNKNDWTYGESKKEAEKGRASTGVKWRIVNP